jgi:hypothetical protein
VRCGSGGRLGESKLVLEARDEQGRRLAQGVYFLRLRAGHEAATGKIVLLK